MTTAVDTGRAICGIALILLAVSMFMPWFTISVLSIDYPLSLWDFYRWGKSGFESLPMELLVVPLCVILAIIAGVVGIAAKSHGTRKGGMGWSALLGIFSSIIFYALVSGMEYQVKWMGVTISLKPWRVDVGFWCWLIASLMMALAWFIAYTREETRKNIVSFLRKFLPIFAFIIPFIILYHLDPKLFEATWKGRTYYLFFLWLFSVETILSWEELRPEKRKLKSIKTFVFVIVLSLPTMYVVAANYFGWNEIIVNLAEKSGVLSHWAYQMPLSDEYLVFMVIFTAILILEYGITNLKDYSISTIFLGTIGVIYTIDNLYPLGRFTPFQIIVPTTTMLSANVLNLMGYHTLWLGVSSGLPTLIAWDSHGNYSSPFSIGWPCSGVESILLYTIIILLFLKKSAISWKHRIIYFTIGAIVTYFINILRIATFFIISINHGDVTAFHNYYGQLYSVTWIISYPLIIIGSQLLWSKIKNWRERKVFQSVSKQIPLIIF